MKSSALKNLKLMPTPMERIRMESKKKGNDKPPTTGDACPKCGTPSAPMTATAPKEKVNYQCKNNHIWHYEGKQKVLGFRENVDVIEDSIVAKILTQILKEEDETTAASPKKDLKRMGNSKKHKDMVKRQLQGSAEAEPEPTTMESGDVAEAKPVPKNTGNVRRHRASISNHLKSKARDVEETPEEEPPLESLIDDVEVPEDEPATDAEITGEEDTDAVDAEIEKKEDNEDRIDAASTARLLTIDRTKINKSLKELCLNPAREIPINKIKEILAKYDLKLVDEKGRDTDVKLVGVDGNTDVELAYKSGKRVNNSALVLYWHQIERSEAFEFHAYLSS